MFEWEQERSIVFKKFYCTLQKKMNDMFYEYEQRLINLEFEKKQILAVWIYKRIFICIILYNFFFNLFYNFYK